MGPRSEGGRTAVYNARSMVRISWPLAILVAAVIAVVARRPRMLVPVLVVFAAWYLWEQVKRSR